MGAAIQLLQAEKVYGQGVQVHALKPVSLDIGAGQLVTILGPSGSGKTTLLNLVGGLDQPSGGRVLVSGTDLGRLTPAQLTAYRRSRVGFVFQFFNLIPSLTARENVELAADLSDRRGHIDAALAAVGLGARADQFPGQLSGGEQQRVAIARALVKDPPLLLCDEPTGSLDFESGKAVLSILQHKARAEGKTVLIVTHNGALAAMATRVIRLKDGAVLSDVSHPHPVAAAELQW